MNEILQQQASLSGLIRTVFIILLVWYVFKLLLRLFAPYLIKKIIQKAGTSFSKNYQQQFQTGQNKYQKNTSDSFSARKKYRSNKKIGEYIDYEEIE